MTQSIESFVGNAMDEAPMSRYHWQVLSIIIAGFFFDVVDLAIIGSLVPDMLGTHFATPTNIATVVSAQLFGLFIGAVGQGELTDRFGRKTVYQANLLLYGAATIAAAFSPNYLVLAALRFVAGIGLGAEGPLCYSYATEFSPKQSRGRNLGLVQLIGGASSWPVAILFAIGFRGIIGWRGIFAVVGTCALIVFVFRFTLPESPRWLATHGQGKQALQLLGRFGIAGPQPGLELSIDAASNSQSDPIGVVFGTFRRRILAAMVSFFSFLSVTFLLSTWMPSMMFDRGFSITKALTFTFGMTLSYPCSALFMMFALDRFGRIRTSVGSFIFAGVAAVAFALSQSETMVLITGFCMFFFVQTAGNSMTIFTVENFPTNARATGLGLAQGAGRVGAAISTYSILAIQAYGLTGVFVGIATLLIIAAYSTTLIGRETKGIGLDAIAAPTD